MTNLLHNKLSRRTVLQSAAVGAIGITPALRAAVYAAGSDAPESGAIETGRVGTTGLGGTSVAVVRASRGDDAARATRQANKVGSERMKGSPARSAGAW